MEDRKFEDRKRRRFLIGSDDNENLVTQESLIQSCSSFV